MSRITVKRFPEITISGNGGTSSISFIGGEILAVLIDYPAANCTVDIDTDGETVSQKIVDLVTANTDRVVYPRVQLHNNVGTNIDLSDAQGGNTAMYGLFVVYGGLTLTIASGTNTQIVNVAVIVRQF